MSSPQYVNINHNQTIAREDLRFKGMALIGL